MKFLSLAIFALSVTGTANASISETAIAPANTLSKAEITAILDVKIKQNIEIEPIVIDSSLDNDDIIMIARNERPIRTRFNILKNVGDE
uniref:hypothetical protein n=1 Tax=Ningiella ruwaisensis TaxID=2364274 RepID=UPI00109F777F|nr:hypothetical protein [Ningiella ruwaisensis]